MKGWLHPAIPYLVVYKQGMLQSSAQGCLLRQYVREDMNLFRPDSGVHSNTLHYSLSTLQELGNRTKVSEQEKKNHFSTQHINE